MNIHFFGKNLHLPSTPHSRIKKKTWIDKRVCGTALRILCMDNCPDYILATRKRYAQMLKINAVHKERRSCECFQNHIWPIRFCNASRFQANINYSRALQKEYRIRRIMTTWPATAIVKMESSMTWLRKQWASTLVSPRF